MLHSWRRHFLRCLWRLWLLLILFLVATSNASNVGLVGFIFPSEELVEGNFVHFVGVKRTNGSSGAVRCNISIVTSNDVHDAEEGKDYRLLSSFVAFGDGDADPKAVVFRFFNDRQREVVSYVRLSMWCLPEEANGLILQHTLKLSDDRDGGIFQLPRKMIRVQEDLLLFPPAESDRCILFVERAGGSSGRARVLVHWHTTPVCAEDDEWPAISEDALFKVDWSYLEGTGSVSWDDGESGAKCAVEKYWLQNFSSTNGSNASAVVVYSDGLVETGEGFCGYITADEGSAAIVPEANGRLPFAMLIQDRGKTGGGQHRCIKGAECSLNLTLSIAVAFLHQTGNWTFVQAAGHGVQCLPCSIGTNQSSYQNLPLHQFEVEGQRFEWAAADLGTSLRNETPGDRSVCMCRDGDPDNATHQIATLVLAGPEGDNMAGCFKNQRSCAIRLREIRTIGGQNHLRIMPSCEDYELTPTGFIEGAVAVADTTSSWYEMNDTDKMRIVAAGIYKLCWCHSFSPSDCTQLSDFNVEAGSFIYAGPYEVVSLKEVRISQALEVEVSGIGLSSDDEAMLLVTCGMGEAILRAGKIQERVFDFGVLGSQGNEVAAGSYQLCWCQPSPGRSCNSTEDFNVAFGSIRIRCHWNYAELDGECKRCHLLFEVPEEEDSVCQIHAGSFALVVLWWFVATLFFLAIVTALRCRLWTLPKRPGEGRGTFSPTLVGTPRTIRDVSQTGGKLIITTNGYHNLIKFPVARWSTIPVTLRGTAHPLLDGVPFHVRVRDGRTLEVLDLDRSPVTFRADSSMGQVEVSFGGALLHSGLHGLSLKLPLLGQSVILAGCSLAIGKHLDPPELQGVAVVAAGALLAILLFLVWLQFVRTSSPLTHSLKIYASNISEKGMTRKTKKGPERAVAVQEVLDLWDNFQHLVRDRNMYYMDANIVKPLTMPSKLSYAELVGPHDAMWFVSHWWGTEFRVYCEALSRHAKAFREDEVTDWKRTTTYWICTFSNNQYQISEELGQSHQESSFYQALHDGTAKGTCMILDEKAMPLTRSWCLFEILQTIFLKKQVVRFQGLFFCTETGVLNRGNSTVEMSIQIGRRMAHLSLEDAEATTEQDKRMIHDLVIGEMESFDHINRVLKKCIGEALTECEKSVSRQFSDLYEELDFVTDSPQRAGADFVTDSPQRAGADFVTDSPQRAGAVRTSL